MELSFFGPPGVGRAKEPLSPISPFLFMCTPVTSARLYRPARGSCRGFKREGCDRADPIFFTLLFGSLWCLSPSSVLADDPVHLRSEAKARRALLQDRELASYNLGVEVEDRVAYLWGTLPDDTLLRRAVDILRKLPEVREVRSLVRIDAERLPAIEAGLPSRFRPGKILATPPPPLGSLMKGVPRRDSPPFTWQYAPGQEPAPSRLQVVSVELSLDQAILVIREGDSRFTRLHHELRGREVYLSGAVASWSDLMALAQAIARLPGVERVVLSQIRTAPAPE
jgi:hypothetical protein